MGTFLKKDWILYEELVNEESKNKNATHAPEMSVVNVMFDKPEENKHVPFITEVSNGYVVKCGMKEFHAEDEEHHTNFIEINIDGIWTLRKYIDFKNGELPEVLFVSPKAKNFVESRAFCNKHGLFAHRINK